MKENLKCAPNKRFSNKSCFSLDQLKKISISFNNAIKKNKINNKKIKLNLITIKDDKRYLVQELSSRLEKVCDDQICWLKQKFIKDLKDKDLLKDTFRPEGPLSQFEWLNTLHIDTVMNQYHKKYKNFKFYGAVPIDFDNLSYLKIKKIDYEQLYKDGIHQIGFIFNLDESWKSGSHWVALYANLNKEQIYFFDSYGTRPEKRIRTLIKRIGKWIYKKNFCNSDKCSVDEIDDNVSFLGKTKNKIENKFDIEYNRNRHQYKNSECGVYSLNFILRLLNGHSFNDITKNKVLDDEINKCRDIYFTFRGGKNPIYK
tara:strand:+ start:2037 stop:2978 length:942 start_codon:yes stop_codon:yes gene_type:complete